MKRISFLTNTQKQQTSYSTEVDSNIAATLKYCICNNFCAICISRLLFTLLNLIRTHGCNGFVYPYGDCPQTPRLLISK